MPPIVDTMLLPALASGPKNALVFGAKNEQEWKTLQAFKEWILTQRSIVNPILGEYQLIETSQYFYVFLMMYSESSIIKYIWRQKADDRCSLLTI